MEERLVEALERSIARAHVTAAAEGLGTVLPEHLLTAILLEDSAASLRLAGSEFALGRLCQEAVGALRRRRVESERPRMTRLSPDVKLVLAVAADRRRWAGGMTLRSEHVLVALLNDSDGGVARLLSASGIDLEEAEGRLAGSGPSPGANRRIARRAVAARPRSIRTEPLRSACDDGRRTAVTRVAGAILFYVAGVAALLGHWRSAGRGVGWLLGSAALFAVFFFFARGTRLYFERR